MYKHTVMRMLSKSIKTIKKEGLSYLLFRIIQQLLAQTHIIRSLYWSISPYYYRKKYQRQYDHYKAPVHPFKFIWVDPQSIRYTTGRSWSYGVGRRKGFMGISGGDWDIDVNRIEELPQYDFLKDHFNQGIKWTETDFYTNRLKRIERNEETWHSCTTEEELLERCMELDRIYECIKANGYRTQDEFRASHGGDYVDEKLNEIIVDIGRDGELLFVDGRHRLIIAQLLELDEIPVICDHRHKQWMEKRDKLYQSGEYDAHPDVPSPREHG